MSAVQRTMHCEDRGGSGDRPEAPWAFERLPPRRQPHTGQLGLFAAVLGCGVVCVEATRRGGAPPPGTHDLLTAWWLPAALLLPPEYALLGPVLIGGYAHWRARQGPLYWRAFTAAALGLAGVASSALFQQVHAHGHWLLNPVTMAEATGCAGLFVLINGVLVGIAGRAAQSGPARPAWRPAGGATRLRSGWDSEGLLIGLAGLCAGLL